LTLFVTVKEGACHCHELSVWYTICTR